MANLMRRTPSAALAEDGFTTLMRRMFNEPLYTAGTLLPASGWAPAVEVSETADALCLTAELPGLDEKQVTVNIENNVLTLSGEKEERKAEEAGRNYYQCERYFGAFQRSFALPRTVDVDKVAATFDKGVLTVTLPKLPQAKGRMIRVEAR
jgi:HSP20 family protein